MIEKTKRNFYGITGPDVVLGEWGWWRRRAVAWFSSDPGAPDPRQTTRR